MCLGSIVRAAVLSSNHRAIPPAGLETCPEGAGVGKTPTTHSLSDPSKCTNNDILGAMDSRAKLAIHKERSRYEAPALDWS